MNNNQNNFLMNISILYRYVQKYFDRNLAQYDIGSGQMNFLLLINEHEGVTMQQLAALADIDKGTTTKAIQKLMEEGYIETQSDEQDKRVKHLYTTAKTAAIINDIYRLRKECCNQLLNTPDSSQMEEWMQTVTNNARSIVPDESYNGVKIGGLQKLTLLDYPNQLACTIFTAGCNLKCPFCHNRDLVFLPENFEFYSPESIIDYLKKRQNVLDAVCITGGEPLVQPGLIDFISEIKDLGYKIKLDTNGFYPDRLKEVVETGMVDYVAMDIKNTMDKYPQTVGLPAGAFQKKEVMKSIRYLLSGVVDYEFRTTVVKELHTPEDLVEIAKSIRSAPHYYLQQFNDSGRCIEEGFSAYNLEEMEEIEQKVKKYCPNAELRGVK